MRSLEAIRDEMGSVAQIAQAAAKAEAPEAAWRNYGWYEALAWVLQENWTPDA